MEPESGVKIEKIEERIFKNWKSSLLGVTIIFACLGLVFAGKTTLSEVALIFPFALGLIWAKDSILKA